MRNSTSLARFLPAALVMALAACGGKGTPAADTTVAAQDAADAAPAKPPSRIADARAFLDKAMQPADIEAAMALAEALAKEGTPEAGLAAARLRLLAVARDVAATETNPEAASHLGTGGADKELRLVLAAVEGASDADGQRVALVAKAMLFALDGKDAPTDEKGLAALQGDPSPEAQAFRMARLAAFHRALGLWDRQGFPAFAAAVGPFLCSGCGPSFDPERCAQGGEAPFCKTLLPAYGKDAVMKLAPNALAIAALGLMPKVGESAPLSGAAKELGEIEAIVLPLPSPADTLVSLGDGPQVALTETSPALVVAHLGPAGLQIGVRAVVAATGELPSAATGVALSDAPTVSAEALAAAEPDKDTGAIAGVTDRLAAVREVVAKAPSEGPAMLLGDRGAVTLAIEDGTPVELVTKVADGLIAGGPGAGLRLLRRGTAGDVLPLHLRALPAALEGALVPSWERPMVVVVSKDAIDVWSPEGPKEGAAPIGPEGEGALPTSLQQGWRKDKLARLEVPLPPAQEGAQHLGPSELKATADAVKVFADKAKAGHVVHVVAGEGATAADVLTVARHLQEVGLEPAPELARVAEIWPGARCRGEVGCAGAVTVAFSKAAVPSARGLTSKPGGKKEEPKEPKPEPGPAPSAEFCNQADIKSQMAKKAGSFRFCYERELQLEKDLAGRVVMNFVIGLQGQVKSVRVASSELKNAKVGECIKKEIGKIQFKPPDGGECVVQWPFKFTMN